MLKPVVMILNVQLVLVAMKIYVKLKLVKFAIQKLSQLIVIACQTQFVN